MRRTGQVEEPVQPRGRVCPRPHWSVLEALMRTCKEWSRRVTSDLRSIRIGLYDPAVGEVN